jgi:hypothetical protein
MTIRVINCKGGHENYDVYIGNRIRFHPEKYPQSKWGNPFKIGKDGTREEVIIKYRKWLLSNPELLKQLPELYGKTLGCWCKPQACHGDVLKDFAEQQELPLKGEEGEEDDKSRCCARVFARTLSAGTR